MDSSTSLIIVNLIINVMLFLNHLIDRIKRSSCFGSNIEFNDNIPNKDNTPRFQNNDLLKILELLNNNKKNDEAQLNKLDQRSNFLASLEPGVKLPLDIKIDIKDDKV